MAAATVTVKIPLDRYEFQLEVDLNDTVETVVKPVRDLLESKKGGIGRGSLATLHFTPSNSTRPVLLNRPQATLERTLQDVGIEDGSILIACKSYIVSRITMFSHSSLDFNLFGPDLGPNSILSEVSDVVESYYPPPAKE